MRSSEALLRLVKLAVIPHGVLLRERRPGVVILIYHRVGGKTDSDIDLPVDLFARQMAYLREHCTVISMNALDEDSLSARAAGSSDLVAVTFDDGDRGVYAHAFPVLLRYRIPATLYLATRYIDAQQPFDFGGYASAPERPLPLTWAQVREMAETGLVTVGAHTHNHVDLRRLSSAAVQDEVGRSRRVIEDRLGITPRHFAYPWGLMTAQVKDIVGEHFRTAVRGGCAKNPFAAMDRLALWRRPVQQSDGFGFFRLKLGSYLDGEEYFRQLAGRLLASPAGTPEGVVSP